MSFTGFQLGLSDDLLEASRKVIESSAEYKKFFDATLKKFGVTSPDELSGEKKKEFFDYIDKNYNSSKEKGEDGKVEGYGKKKAVKEDSDKRAGDACWKGYKQVGMKKKDGKEVPNCVPMNEEELKEAGIDKSDVDYSHIEEDIKLRDVEGIEEVISDNPEDEHDQVPTPTPTDEEE